MRLGMLVWLAGWLVAAAANGQDAGQRYVIDPAQSNVHWLVYKAGAFSRFGHNHTVSIGDLAGEVVVDAADLAKSRFELQFAVANLVVDDPALRSTLGTEFESVPSADDIVGTRRNMLSDRVLDGEKYPRIRLVGTGPTAQNGAQSLAVTIEILGRTIALTLPTQVNVGPDELTAKGEFELNHADLGMKPFSVMAGALQVGEKLSFTYDIKARRQSR